MSEILLKIGKKIKKKRLELNISKKKLSSDIKLSMKYLSKIESGTLDDEMSFSHCARYLKLYCNYLDINDDLIIKEYNEYYLSSGNEKRNKFFTNNSEIIEDNNKIFISILIFILFIIFISNFINKDYINKINSLDKINYLLHK